MDLTGNPDPQQFINEILSRFDIALTTEQANIAVLFLCQYGARDIEECFDCELIAALEFAKGAPE